MENNPSSNDEDRANRVQVIRPVSRIPINRPWLTTTSTPTVQVPIHGLISFQHTILNNWYRTTVRSELLSRHKIYNPNPIEWADTIPMRRFVRVRPTEDHNFVTAFGVYKHLIIVGFTQGHLVCYDLNSMSLMRTYYTNTRFAITQIVTGKKFDRFFVTSANQFIEFSYYDDNEKFRYTGQYLIRNVLSFDFPLLIVDAIGTVFEYMSESEELNTAVIQISGLNLNEIQFIHELKSFDPYIHEKTRPVLISNRGCIALVNFELNSEQKLSLWRKELLCSDTNDRILICCFEEKFFYTKIQREISQNSNVVYVSAFNDIGSRVSKEPIRASPGVITKIECSSDFLIVINQETNVEIFDARTQIKKYHLCSKLSINKSLIIKNTILLGTKEGSIIVESLQMSNDAVCSKCENSLYFEHLTVYRKCRHNLPYETQMQFY